MLPTVANSDCARHETCSVNFNVTTTPTFDRQAKSLGPKYHFGPHLNWRRPLRLHLAPLLVPLPEQRRLTSRQSPHRLEYLIDFDGSNTQEVFRGVLAVAG